VNDFNFQRSTSNLRTLNGQPSYAAAAVFNRAESLDFFREALLRWITWVLAALSSAELSKRYSALASGAFLSAPLREISFPACAIWI